MDAHFVVWYQSLRLPSLPFPEFVLWRDALEGAWQQGFNDGYAVAQRQEEDAYALTVPENGIVKYY